MPRSISITQTNALGNRIRKTTGDISEDDLKALQRLRADHDPAMDSVQEALTNLGLQATSRLKTPGTIVDKLRREATRLSKMQDIAGVRIVQDMRLDEQDAVVERILSVFPGAKEDDRRSRPSHGYRAVHVIPTVDDCPVEIQVRTYLQDLWAQIMEGLEGELGRGVRYGEKPLRPRRRFPAGSKVPGRPTQTQLVKAMTTIARLIEAVEIGRAASAQGDPRTRKREFQRRLAQAEKEVRSTCEQVLASLGKGSTG